MKRLVIMFALAATPAFSHEAPSGWSYPLSCCSLRDCRPVTSADVAETPDGYLIRATREIVPYNDSRVKPSGDNEMHLCQQYGDFDNGRVLCLFEPPRGF